MTLQPFSLLTGFLAAVEGTVAAVLLVTLRGARNEPDGGADARERGPLHAWIGFVLVTLSLASWPLLYLWMQGLVPRWPDVMCIQGVTRIGTGDPGPARFFPPLVEAVQTSKPVLVFLAGAWLALHLADRRTRRGALVPALRVVLGVLAVVALLDAAFSLVAVTLPLDDRSYSAGCCTSWALVDGPRAPWPFSAWAPQAAAPFVTATHLGLAALLLVALTRWRRAAQGGRPFVPSAFLAMGAAAASFPVALALLGTVLAPRLLGRPEHFCGYCALAEAPETLLGVGAFTLGAFATGWAGVLAWVGRHSETSPAMVAQVARLIDTARVAVTTAAFFVLGAMALR